MTWKFSGFRAVVKEHKLWAKLWSALYYSRTLLFWKQQRRESGVDLEARSMAIG